MIQTMELQPGVTLRCFKDTRFKQACLSLTFIRPMCREEASLNALLPTVLLRGSTPHPDLRDITLRLDDLYGAGVSVLTHRVGDYQATGLRCQFMEDRYALEGDAILTPMIDFLRELLYEPVTENGAFSHSYVESEKKNLISAIDSALNDKQVYAMSRLMKTMCRDDSYGIPRLGDRETAAAITPQSAYDHYRRVIKESRIDICYVGSAPAQEVARLVKPLYEHLERDYKPLPPHTPFRDAGSTEQTEEKDVTQSILCLGFTTPITDQSREFVAMQMLNLILGSGMTSKLFMNVREKLSLCYSIGSSYISAKGILTVGAGIDAANEEQTRREILRQLQDCREGKITDDELNSARQAILSSLRGLHDSPMAIENYYATRAISGSLLSPEEYRSAALEVTKDQVAAAARTVRLHSTYFLKGVTQ